MKVSEIMQKTIFSVSEDTPLKDIGRIIFSIGIGAVPVVRDKKLVGIVTKEDILKKLFPTPQELFEDYVHEKDFNNMEKKLADFLEVPAKEIMNPNVTSIPSDTPVMKAQSMILTHSFSHLLIVDKDNNLLGILTQGDIFRHLLRNEMPRLEKERYAGFISRNYDLMVNWKKRFEYEFPELIKQLDLRHVNSVLDIGVWTGEYTIGFAKQTGFKILGLDNNPVMINIADSKKEKLPNNVKKKVDFLLTDYLNLKSEIKEKYDAAICMGNSLPYIPIEIDKLFKEISFVLKDEAIMILQILNLEKILKKKDRLLSFNIQKDRNVPAHEHLFMEFFDIKDKKTLNHHVVVFDYNGKSWFFKGITTIPITNIGRDEISSILHKIGFKNVSFSGNMGEYQGEYGKLSFEGPFDPSESDWMNVVAKR